MVLIANLQYGWTLFVRPMHDSHDWNLADIQVAFSLFVALETWLTPIQGWIADRIGPKLVIAAGGILVAAGWILGGEPPCSEPRRATPVVAWSGDATTGGIACFLRQLGPVGGWNPYAL